MLVFSCRLVQEHETGGIYTALMATPERPRFGDVLAFLFAGMESLFYMSAPSPAERSECLAGCSPKPLPASIPSG